MPVNFTDMQKEAIKAKGNVLVSAAAGSGKTAVLTERVIKLLTNKQKPVSADRLLIVTFTNAAAAEMKTRIEKRLYEEISKDSDNPALLRQKHLLSNADICTIDSFCIKLVRENFAECGIEPDFAVSEGSDLIAVSNSVMSGILGEYFDDKCEDFAKLLEFTACEYDEKNLASLIERIYLYTQQLPFPNSFLDGFLKVYETEFDARHPWAKRAFDICKKRLNSAREIVAEMAETALKVSKNQEGANAYAATASLLLDTLLSVAAQKDWDALYKALHEASLPKAPSLSSKDSFDLQFKKQIKQLSSALEELNALFCAQSSEIQGNLDADSKSVRLLVELVKKYGERLLEAYRAANTFTFYNIEQMALELLCSLSDGEIIINERARALSTRYDEVLVDEFQDVNDLQNMLFYVLSNREEKLFVVGDVKQSIYGFRGSNPQNFLDKKASYVDFDRAGEGESKKIILSQNFRSRKGVCDAVNYYFSLLMGGQRGNLVYDSEEYLYAGAEFPQIDAPETELMLVDKCGNEDDDSLLQSEARAIAEYIKGVMSEGAVIRGENGELREARYSDFAVLLDKVKDKSDVLSEILQSLGIPVAHAAEDFMESFEISTLLSLLQIIDNPESDVQLLSVMMSPMFAFSAEEMALIRCENKRESLYKSVITAAHSGNNKASSFLDRLAEFRARAAILPLNKLLSYLVDSTDFLNGVSAMTGGKIRALNVAKLEQVADKYCAASQGSIYGFLRYLKSLPEKPFKSGVASGENRVKIMSMHSSKGLQFPVCIIANLASRINYSDSISNILYSEKLGLGLKYYDEEKHADFESLGHRLIALEAREKTIEERLRLLYVAMTRAEDRLCLVCACKNANKDITRICETLKGEPPYISGEFLDSSTNMRNWILAATLLHPDAKALRDKSDAAIKPISSDLRLNVCVINEFDYDGCVAESGQKQTVENKSFIEQIKRNSDYKYPFEELRKIQAKASVSELANAAESDKFAFGTKPAFLQNKGITATMRGTATHKVMQFMNFAEKPNIEAEINRLVEWQFITETEATAVDKKAIEAFFQSDLYKRILSAREFRREMRFLTEMPAKSLDNTLSDVADEVQIVVQGAVDLCFVEDDGICVLDFKTDGVEDINALADTYGEQLRIYASACEKIFSLPIKEKILYSFSLSSYIKV